VQGFLHELQEDFQDPPKQMQPKDNQEPKLPQMVACLHSTKDCTIVQRIKGLLD
jgi:hypothetical protein